MKKIVYLAFIFIAVSCSNPTTKVIETTVTLSTVVKGTLSGTPKIEYRDVAGTLKSEVLTVGNWNKTFKVNEGFKLFVKATGIIDGNIELNASAISTDGSVNFADNRNMTNTPALSFDVQISTTL